MEFDLNAIWDMIVNQGIFAVLFVWLFLSSRKDSAEREKASAERESKLMTCLNEQGQQLKENTHTLENINIRIEKIEDSLK